MGALTFAVVSIGDELMEGRHVDRNAAVISKALMGAGLEPRLHLTLADEEDLLTSTFKRLASEVDIIVSSGGLGPTLDDTTRSAGARAAGVELERSASAEAVLRQLFEDMGREMVLSNLRQVDFPVGAHVLANGKGTAPGFGVAIGGAWYFALPGPPREMGPMLEAAVLPLLSELGLVGRKPDRRSFFLYAQSESVFAEEVAALGDWMAPDADPRMGVTAGAGLLAVELVARTATDEAAARLAERVHAFRVRYSEWIYSETEKSLGRVLAKELIESGVSIALAESCTGGRIAADLCRNAGISAVFERAWVVYSAKAKQDELGVPRGLIEDHGVVSSEVAAAMAVGAAQRSGARLALSVTGVAGPGPNDDGSPEGLVWFGLCSDGAVQTFERRFPPVGRVRVQTWAEVAGLIALLEGLRRLTG